MVCSILVPQPRIEPGSLLVKVQRPNHWAAREFPRKCSCFVFLKKNEDFHGRPVVETLPFQCRDAVSIPGWETEILLTVWHGQNKK